MKKLVLLLAAAALFSLTGCISQYSPSVNTTAINSVDFSKSKSWKEGESCQLRILNLLPIGTASVKNAAEYAGLSKVELVDYNYQWYWLFERLCIKAYGK